MQLKAFDRKPPKKKSQPDTGLMLEGKTIDWVRVSILFYSNSLEKYI